MQLRADVNLITSSSKRSSEIRGKETYPDGCTNQSRVLRTSAVVIRAKEPWGEAMGVRRDLFPGLGRQWCGGCAPNHIQPNLKLHY